MATAITTGRATMEEVAAIEDALERWSIEIWEASKVTASLVRRCLSEEFLLSLDDPKKKHYWPENLGPKSWRYLFRRHCTRLLGYQQVEYQHYMRGVDVVDQMRRDYTVQFHSYKWWHKLFFFVLDSSLMNARMLYSADKKARGEDPGRRSDFHYAVAEYLFALWLDPPKTCDFPCLTSSAIHYSAKHWKIRRQCIVCNRKKNFFYPACAGAFMCLESCFVKVHTQRKWWLKVLRF